MQPGRGWVSGFSVYIFLEGAGMAPPEPFSPCLPSSGRLSS